MPGDAVVRNAAQPGVDWAEAGSIDVIADFFAGAHETATIGRSKRFRTESIQAPHRRILYTGSAYSRVLPVRSLFIGSRGEKSECISPVRRIVI